MTEFIRRPSHRYEDPLNSIWTRCANQLGFTIKRTEAAYASTDGKGTLLIAVDSMLDPDDCLAQMIFHELCHALVEGEEGEKREDWGLGTIGKGDPWREHACLRLQAYLAAAHGLRNFFAPTTDYRVSFWNHLPENPFAAPEEQGGRREKSCIAARQAAQRAASARWHGPLTEALKATAAIGSILTVTERPADPNPASQTEQENRLPTLWSELQKAPPTHPAGHATLASWHPDKICEDCAWSHTFRGGLRCRHTEGIKLKEKTPACTRYEPKVELNCQTCGACCREAYDSVEISEKERVNRRHPELVIIQETYRKLRRTGNRCAALGGGNTPQEPYACQIYEDRPATCRQFTEGSAHCLTARRKVGLSL